MATQDSSGFEYDHFFKVVLLGDEAVGKTALLHRFAHDYFGSQSKLQTSEFKIRKVHIEGEAIKLQAWDINHKDRHAVRTAASNYYRGAHGFLLAFDLTKRSSFQNCAKWMAEVRKLQGNDGVVLILGNKSDLKKRRAVSYAEAKAFCNENHCMYLETSARLPNNVDEAFIMFCMAVLRQHRQSPEGKAKSGVSKTLRGNRSTSTTAVTGEGREKKGSLVELDPVPISRKRRRLRHTRGMIKYLKGGQPDEPERTRSRQRSSSSASGGDGRKGQRRVKRLDFAKIRKMMEVAMPSGPSLTAEGKSTESLPAESAHSGVDELLIRGYFATVLTAADVPFEKGVESFLALLDEVKLQRIPLAILLSASGDTLLHELTRRTERGSWAYLRSLIGHLQENLVEDEFNMVINMPNRAGNTALHVAAARGHEDVVRMLLQFQVEVSTRNSDGETALYVACARGKLHVCSLLLPKLSLAVINQADVHGNTPLHIASRQEFTDVVGLLIQFKASQTAQDSEGMTASQISRELKNRKARQPVEKLFRALRLEDVDGVKALLGEVDMASCVEVAHGDTPLHIAAFSTPQSPLFSMVLDLVPELSARNDFGNTPLHVAAMQPWSNCVAALLERGAPLLPNTVGNTPLHLALYAGHNASLALLIGAIQADARLHVDSSNEEGLTALHIACSYDNADAVTALLAADSDPCAANKQGETSMHIAASRGNLSIVQLLLNACDERGQDGFSLVDKQGNSILLAAAAFQQTDVIQELVRSKRCAVDARNNEGESVLHMLARGSSSLGLPAGDGSVNLSSEYLDTLKDMVKRGVPVNGITTVSGDTPLHVAVAAGQVQLVRVLLECGAGPNFKNGLGDYPVHITAEIGNVEILNLLAAKDANVHNETQKGFTALHLACAQEHLPLVTRLLELGVDIVHCRNADNLTALHVASSSGNLQLVQLLLKNCDSVEFSVNIATSSGDTALTFAIAQGHSDVARLLLEHSAHGRLIDTGLETQMELVEDPIPHYYPVILAQDVEPIEELWLAPSFQVFRAKVQSKYVLATKALDEGAVDVLRRSILMLSILGNHPNVVRCVGASLVGQCCLFVEDVLCGTLDRLLCDTEIPLHLLDVLQIARDVAKGMKYLHIHTPSKPAIIHNELNRYSILIDEGLVAKLQHFGSAKIHPNSMLRFEDAGAEQKADKYDKTKYREQLSLLPDSYSCYTAPEVTEGNPCSAKSDAFSFGMVLWELLTREQPFLESSLFEAIRSISEGVRPRIPQSLPTGQLVPEALRSLLAQCWHQDPDERPTFVEISEALNAIMASEKKDLMRQLSATEVLGVVPTGSVKRVGLSFHSFQPKPHILEFLGSGGSGTKVYRCELGGIVCVLKEWAEGTSTMADPLRVEGVLNEISILQRLSHCPQVVQYIYHTTGKCIRLYMEELDGGSLRQMVKKRRAASVGSKLKFFSAKEILAFVLPVAQALRYMHTLDPPVIHRDIKADNVFVSKDRQTVKLGDFGTSLEFGDRDPTTVVGTMGWTAPEVLNARKEGHYTLHADVLTSAVFSFGMFLYEMLALTAPFSDSKFPNYMIEQGAIPTLPKAVKSAAEYQSLRELFLSCISSNPDSRPDASSLEEALLAMQ